MATTKKAVNPEKKIVQHGLTLLDVRQAAHDGQKVFDTVVMTGKLPVPKQAWMPWIQLVAATGINRADRRL
ncbi:hypothetical protein [Pseudomonas silesiensis]|uniref:hypothetical protein n=1 Tax=Pseudomonas silesiensis TaxID=1853130 RepID=UPI0030D710DA